MAELSKGGVHDPAHMPFAVPWTDLPPVERARGVMQHHWAQLAAWRVDNWKLPLTVFRSGEVVGVQSLTGRDFATVKQVSSGSWLGLEFQRQGIGTEMRAAVLELAFVGLGAKSALTAALVDNPASIGVSTRLGYQPNGVVRSRVRSGWEYEQQFVLDVDGWSQRRSIETEISGLDECIDLFGALPPD
ncbi:putative succinyl-CoA transferase [Microlunatus endophyticus]|uniref:Succinyl-CoA transferase n=1 Tax=Microlunatus endophyticus TaxID=1716077 RepID=A0A917SJW6_9ACTN|nr:putative succinyl-CoA transferase [Microlunatus endophyticus]